MKNGIILALSLFSSIAFADPTVFGLQIGKTTEAELKKLYKVTSTGINKYNNGNMYSIPVSAINFEGLQEVTAMFDTKGTLVAVLTTFPTEKFDYLNGVLKNKYKLVSQVIPYVGDKSVKYRDGATEITLDAPHMSFEMNMDYIHDDLNKAYMQKSEAEKAQKKNNEASQL